MKESEKDIFKKVLFLEEKINKGYCYHFLAYSPRIHVYSCIRYVYRGTYDAMRGMHAHTLLFQFSFGVCHFSSFIIINVGFEMCALCERAPTAAHVDGTRWLRNLAAENVERPLLWYGGG